MERALTLLELIADSESPSLTELSTMLALPVPTTHRLLKTLVNLGYVRQFVNRRYGLGLGLVRLGERADTQFAPIAKPHLDALADTLGESANLAVLDGSMVVYIAQSPSHHAMRMFTEVGHRAYTHSTGVGKAILANLPPAEAHRVINTTGMPAATDQTITDWRHLEEELERIRGRGYAIDDGEQEVGVSCYAVAVPKLPIRMAISISGPAFRMTAELAAKAVPMLHDEAAALSNELLGKF